MPPGFTPQTYSGHTTVYGNTANTTVYANPNPAQGLADLGAALANVAAREQYMDACMTSQGWTQVSKDFVEPEPAKYTQQAPARKGFALIPSASFANVTHYTRKITVAAGMNTEPALGGEIVTVLRQGDDFIVMQEQSGWVYGESHDGKRGYASKNWLNY